MSDLPTTYDEPVRIAVIGGTGISSLTSTGFTPVAVLTVTTPWGAPSSPITILRTPHTSVPIAFLSRHGTHHQITPSEVPNRANIAALRKLGVRAILAFSAVGSLQAHIAPRDFVVPDQIIDRTKGIRASTFFGDGIVGHVGFAEPFSRALRELVLEVADALDGVNVHRDGTVVCMEGPAFSTRAESNLYRSWGGSVINMSALPEAKLAREAEVEYVLVCMSTDYDCWKVEEKPVDVATVMESMRVNAENAKVLVGKVLERLAEREKAGEVVGKGLEGASRWAVCTKEEGVAKEARERLEWLGIWGGN